MTQVYFTHLFVVALRGISFARDSHETIVLSMMTDVHALSAGTVVCVHAKAMQESLCVAASEETIATRTLIPYDAKRLGIKTRFQDINDMQFGKGMSAMLIRQPRGRDRMLLFNALSIALLILRAAARGSPRDDRWLKAKTVKTRTHSLFRQG